MHRIIFFSLCLTIVMAACNSKKPADNGTAVAFANETDFICGMKVKPSFTDTCHYKDKVYAFCSESCKEEFKANPESFLNSKEGK